MKYEELYCFSFNPKLDKEEREQGWLLVDLSEEYRRMGLPDSYWQLSDVNRDYRVSGAILVEYKHLLLMKLFCQLAWDYFYLL